MRALVLGLGKSGTAAKALLDSRGVEVVALDGDAPFPLGAFSFAVVSPGIPFDHPWVCACRERNIPLKSELQLGCEELRSRGWRLLAVTGSKGKSSVVKLVADALSRTGARAVPCGNYGTPVSEVALSAPVGWAAVEVSSFMMETTTLPAGTFEAAALLNLQDDHLDRHRSRETYHALKRKLLSFASVAIDGTALAPHAGDDALLASSYFDNPCLRVNGRCAIRLLRVAGLSEADIASSFRDFVPLKHRMNVILKRGGVRYIDDSKATSLAALAAGVVMAASSAPREDRSVRLIAGGLAKGDDPNSVVPILTKHVKKVYLIGRCAPSFHSAWKDALDCEICGTLSTAVERARRDAVDGETVLLSPGTASFDQFKSFGERGDAFASLVKNEGQKEHE